MRILFMGTPDIAAQSLSAILAQGRHTVCAVFTREDKPVGRKQVLTAPPVKTLALEQGIPVYQPRTLRTPEAAQTVRALAPDIIVVVAYGASCRGRSFRSRRTGPSTCMCRCCPNTAARPRSSGPCSTATKRPA